MSARWCCSWCSIALVVVSVETFLCKVAECAVFDARLDETHSVDFVCLPAKYYNCCPYGTSGTPFGFQWRCAKFCDFGLLVGHFETTDFKIDGCKWNEMEI